jgi:hypothetical protein
MKTAVNRQEIKNLWQIIEVSPRSIIEMRAIKGREVSCKRFHASNYPSPDAMQQAFEEAALRYNNSGFNIYIVMNPIKPECKGGSASDDDIDCRKLLLIDIDRALPSKAPASESELEAAEVLAKQIRDYLKEGGLKDPIVVMSGNGYHLYYKLDAVDNNPENTAQIEIFLKKLAEKFDNQDVKVDTCVYNASRITKVVGTIARKGVETAERPYRMARVVTW